ncbi:MAG: sigma-54-dependent Fis family transcriptional regulator [SAR324 cluster bacterium]|nr:sigma-54-dependent Fis family transcriptional regulator [SAR324 cluster bacterium]
MAKPGRVLFIDDEEEVRLAYSDSIRLEGYDVVAIESAAEALEHISQNWNGIIISDIKMPLMDGMELLSKVNKIDNKIPVILITGHGDIELAVTAMHQGAYDFITKPVDPLQILDIVRRSLEKRNLVLENRDLRIALDSLGAMEQKLIGKSPEMQALRQSIVDLAPLNVEVLINGATGTGKEVTARCLHNFGVRTGRFVAINCGAIPASVIESELFGHEAGSFTSAQKTRTGKIEYADGGTLFLDEIESMPLQAQIMLLRVLEERTITRLGGNEEIPVDIRLIAASKTDLKQAVADKLFREDLYYRLQVVSLDLSPLKHRSKDIPMLFQHFTKLASLKYRRPVPELSPYFLQILLQHDWPGNIRELRNEAERFVLGQVPAATEQVQDQNDQKCSSSLNELLANYEKKLIQDALLQNSGKIEHTADELGIPRKTLYLRMQKYNIKRKIYL